MVEEIKPRPLIPDILTLVSKEKFRRGLLISTRVIAVLLICAIIWVGFVQIAYVKEVNQIRAKYGSLGYCYLCGQETLRMCKCQYRPDIERKMGIYNITDLQQQTALANVQSCPNINSNATLIVGLLNVTQK